MTESQIESWLGKQLKTMDCLYYKFTSPGNDGVPDRIIILPMGQVVFTELKTEGGRLSPMQRYQINRIRNHNCIVWVVHGMDDAEKLLELIGMMLTERHAV